MPAWKVLLVMVFGIVCLVLGLATVIVPMTLVQDNSRWLWLVGLLFATGGMGALFRLFLNSADRALAGTPGKRTSLSKR
jgi:uncharacterized membrane protein HdeD (DUF308 family)